MNAQSLPDVLRPRRIFLLLVGYRWLSLIPPLTLLLTGERPLLPPLLIAAGVNLLISIFSTQLNQALRSRPWLLLADLLLMAALMNLSGAWEPTFYLYALNPLLIAAFFWGLRGAAAATTLFLAVYLLGLALTGRTMAWLPLMTAVVGAYLISGAFGYASSLVTQLQAAQTALKHTHGDLALLHQLTVRLQQAPDVEGMQEVVLEAVTGALGMPCAVMGLVDAEAATLTGWLGRARDGRIASAVSLAHPAQLPLAPHGDPLVQAVLDGAPCSIDADDAHDWLRTTFGMRRCLILPMRLPERPLAVLLVEGENEAALSAQQPLLVSLAAQTAIAIDAMQNRLSRARQTAVHEERIRIAQDLHDTVSQALFGIVFTLDGSLKLLPQQPEAVMPELERALQSAENVRAEIRHTILDIWPTTLTAERFSADLHRFAHDVCHVNGLALTFDIRGEFGALSPLARRSLYRISQEALNNIAQHAQATEASVCVDIAQGRAQLSIRDNGVGFDPQQALRRRHDHDHFGLQGIVQRSTTLGGECHIFSKPGAGASIIVDIPVS